MRFRDGLQDWARGLCYELRLSWALIRKDFPGLIKLLKVRRNFLTDEFIEHKLGLFLRWNVVKRFKLPTYENLPHFCAVAHGKFWRVFVRNFAQEADYRFFIIGEMPTEEKIWSSVVSCALEAMGAVQKTLAVRETALTVGWPDHHELNLSDPAR